MARDATLAITADSPFHRSMRAALYARYSSEQQSENSIEDQLRLCRELAARLGARAVEVYTDYAISGSSTVNRPGFLKLIEDGRAGSFDVVIAEDLDRLSRDQADTATLFKQMEFAGVEIHTVAGGRVDELQVGLKSTMNALFLKQLAQKTRRGQRGRVEAGRIPGGLSYGYRKVVRIGDDGEPERGLREIHPEQAANVVRIFEDYAAGRGTREIAAALNAEGVPGPRGGAWRANALQGNRARRSGILHNELYIGRIVYNRQRFVKDPETGRRQSRPNPESEWITRDVPDLRIVPQPLWDRVHKAMPSPGAPRRRNRRARPLSGMLECSLCGGSVTIVQTERYGCSSHRERGTCDNAATIAVADLEARVLEGLRDHLLHPEVVSEFVRAYHRGARENARRQDRQRDDLERKLADAEARIARIIDAIAGGTDSRSMHDALRTLEDEKAACAAALSHQPSAEVISLHPNMHAIFVERVEELSAVLRSDARDQAAAALRQLVDKITLIPTGKRGKVDIEIHGHLAAMMQLAQGKPLSDHTTAVKVVAGAGFEPATFRL